MARVLTRLMLNREPAVGENLMSNCRTFADEKLEYSLVIKLAIATGVSHPGIELAARPEDLAGHLALDRILPRVLASAVGYKSLVVKHHVVQAEVTNFGVGMVTRENGAVADVAEEAETEPFGGI